MFSKLANFAHLFHINWILYKHGIDEVILSMRVFRFVRFLRFFSPFYWLHFRKRPSYGERIRRTLEDLGPIFIKFGQMLSTRRDLLPPDIADELVKLQDQVPPFCGNEAQEIIEKALQKSVEEAFAEFDSKPLASASIAQVHAATLFDGSKVVVKVLRPKIEKTIRRDINLMMFFARILERFWSEGERLKPVEIIAEYERTIFDELNLAKEAANASQLRRNFENNEMLYIPTIYWDYCKNNILVMERVYGTPVDNIETLKAQGVSLKLLAERGVEIFFTQVFRDNFFHADMHPGNIFVKPDGQYIIIDFGIMGSLTENDRRYLAENLLAFFNRDYYRVAQLHVDSGWVPKDTNVQDFEGAIRTVCEPIFDRPLSEISFGYFLLNLFQTAKRFDMEVQPQLVLLQKTLLNIEGLGRQLYPQLDLWVTAKPFMERWLKSQIGPKAFFNKIRLSLPYLSEQLPEMPQLIYSAVSKVAQGELDNQHAIERLTCHLEAQQKQMKKIMAGSTLTLSGSLFTLFSDELAKFGVILLVVGLFVLLKNCKKS